MGTDSWTFITNHGAVLAVIARRPDATMAEIAREVGVAERTAARIIADLRHDAYVTARRDGARNHYRVNPRRRLRHGAFADVPLSNLLEALSEIRPAGPHRRGGP